MGKKYFETKTGSLEDVSTKIAKEQPTITKPELNVKLERKTYFDNKPGSLEDMAAKVVSEGMDPVNKDAVKKKFADRKDKDIDNGGDVDSSDKFLHKRRKAISKAMSETRRRTYVVGDAKEKIKQLGLTRKGNVVYDKSGKYFGYVYKTQGTGKTLLHKVTGIEGKPFSQSPPVRKDQRPAGVKYQPSTDGITGKKFAGEELDKEDEPKVKKVVGMLKKASAAHAAQSKELDKAVKEAVRPDDKGEIINKKKHDAYGDPKKGEVKPVDPEPKISQVIKGEKENTRANGFQTKKKFSEMRMKLGNKGKTDTGKDAPTIDTEPKAERI